MKTEQELRALYVANCAREAQLMKALDDNSNLTPKR